MVTLILMILESLKSLNMKSIVCFGYILMMFLYFLVDYSKLSGALFLVGQTIFIAFLCHLVSGSLYDEIEKLFFKYVEYLSLANVAYIIICYIRGSDFAIYNTDVFAYIIGVSFVAFALQSVYLRGKK